MMSDRVNSLEEQAAKADGQISQMRGELAEAEAQEAVQCLKWRQKYMEEVAQARTNRDRSEHVEVRLQSSTMLAAESSTQNLQVENMKTEVVERGAQWAAERDRLIGEISDLEATSSLREGKAAGYELQMQEAAEAATQADVMRGRQTEVLARARAEARSANFHVEACDAARVSVEDRTARTMATVEVLQSECRATSKLEATAIDELRGEAR